MKTDDLITLLAQDTAVRLNLNQALWQAVTSAVLIAGIAFVAAVGFRSDIDSAARTGRFLFKFVITIALALSGSNLLFQIGRPGLSLRLPVLMLFVPIMLAVGAAVFELMVMPSEVWVPRMLGHNSRLCVTIIPGLSLGPLACFLAALRYGAPERPGLAGAVAGLAAAGIAATFYAANCDDDSPLFVLLWYPVAIGMVATVGWALGRKILHW